MSVAWFGRLHLHGSIALQLKRWCVSQHQRLRTHQPFLRDMLGPKGRLLPSWAGVHLRLVNQVPAPNAPPECTQCAAVKMDVESIMVAVQWERWPNWSVYSSRPMARL